MRLLSKSLRNKAGLRVIHDGGEAFLGRHASDFHLAIFGVEREAVEASYKYAPGELEALQARDLFLLDEAQYRDGVRSPQATRAAHDDAIEIGGAKLRQDYELVAVTDVGVLGSLRRDDSLNADGAWMTPWEHPGVARNTLLDKPIDQLWSPAATQLALDAQTRLRFLRDAVRTNRLLRQIKLREVLAITSDLAPFTPYLVRRAEEVARERPQARFGETVEGAHGATLEHIAQAADALRQRSAAQREAIFERMCARLDQDPAVAPPAVTSRWLEADPTPQRAPTPQAPARRPPATLSRPEQTSLQPRDKGALEARKRPGRSLGLVAVAFVMLLVGGALALAWLILM